MRWRMFIPRQQSLLQPLAKSGVGGRIITECRVKKLRNFVGEGHILVFSMTAFNILLNQLHDFRESADIEMTIFTPVDNNLCPGQLGRVLRGV